MSRSFEPVRWNACVYRLYLGLYSHPKEFLGNGISSDLQKWLHISHNAETDVGCCPCTFFRKSGKRFFSTSCKAFSRSEDIVSIRKCRVLRNLSAEILLPSSFHMKFDDIVVDF